MFVDLLCLAELPLHCLCRGGGVGVLLADFDVCI